MINYKIRYLYLIIFFFCLINLTVLSYAKCSLNDFYYTSKGFGFEHAFNSCRKLYKSFIITSSKEIISDTWLEKPLRKILKKELDRNYEIIKKDNFKSNLPKQFNFKEGKHKNISNHKLEEYLKVNNLSKNNNKLWFTSGGNYKNLRFLNSKENINISNINNLKLAWKYDGFDSLKNSKNWRQNIAINPIFIDKKLIFISADYKIIALNAIDGKKLWEKKFLLEPTKRGITASKENNGIFLYLTIGNSLIKLNVNDGELEKSFGKGGIINNIKSLTPPIIFDNEVIITSLLDVKFFDIKSGRFKYKIDIHPKNKSFKKGGVVWAGNALDKKNRLLFLPVGNPRPALIGIDRKGENSNANSLIAIDLKKRNIKWVFQDVIHDLWDFDVSSPPILTNLKFGNKILETVIITTKTGNTHVLERNSGHSLFKINYKEAPRSKIFGEITSKFQIDQDLPEKLINIEFDPNQLTLESKKDPKILMEIEGSTYGWFEPPSFGKKLIIKGIHGGATWTGSAINPEKNIIFTPVNNYPFYILVEGKTTFNINPEHNYLSVYKNKCSSCHGTQRNGVIDINTKKKSEMVEKIVVKNNKISAGYMPSLIGHSLFNSKNLDQMFLSKKFDFYHKNLITSDEKEKFKTLFKKWDQKLLDNDAIHFRYHWAKFTNDNNLPPTKEPWGKIVAMNIKSGKKLWETSVGKLNNQENLNNMKGTINYGGVALNGGNILFFTGTPDKNIYALNAKNGEVIWSYEMKAAGSTSPIIYEIDNKQFISILATGGAFNEFKEKASVLYTFSLK